MTWNDDLHRTCQHTIATHPYLAVRDVSHEIIRMLDTGKGKDEIKDYLSSVIDTPYHGVHTQLAISHAITLLHEFFSEVQ